MVSRAALAVLLVIVALVSSQGSQVRASNYSPACAGVIRQPIFCLWQSKVANHHWLKEWPYSLKEDWKSTHVVHVAV